MSDRRARRAQAIKSRIIDATFNLIRDKEIDAIQVEEICEKADVSRKTFYAYYLCKESVLANEVLAVIRNHRKEDFQEAEKNFETFQDRLHFFLEKGIERAKHYGEFEKKVYKISMAYEAKGEGIANQEKILHGSKALFQQWIEAAQNTGEITKIYPANFLATCVVGLMMGIDQNWATVPDYPHIERRQQMEKFVMRFFAP